MWLLYDNVAVMAVAGVACAYAWLFGGIIASSLVPVMPWLTVLLCEVMLCFPQRRRGETTYEARERCWESLKEDKLTWVTLGFMVLLAIPFVNRGLCPVCDYPALAAGASAAPTIPVIPYCVNRFEHLNVVMWFVPSLTAMLAVKHALLKRGKRMVLELIVWNGMALGVLGMIQYVTGAEGPLWQVLSERKVYFFSTFGYANMGGDYFVTLFGLAVALWRWKLEAVRRGEMLQDREGALQISHKVFWRKHLMLIPAAICFISALLTLSRAAIVAVTGLMVLFFIHSIVCFLKRMPRAGRVRAGAFSMLVLVAIAVSAMLFMPSDVVKEAESVGMREMLDRLSGKSQHHSRVAISIWKENFLFGCGGWGYRHFSMSKLTDEELHGFWAKGAANVHNDSLQFLCEHGLVGFGCLVAIVAMLLWPLGKMWKLLVADVRFRPPGEQPPRPVAVFAMPAPVTFILLTALSTYLHSFADCPLRSPAVLCLFFVSLAAMDGFLPRLNRE